MSQIFLNIVTPEQNILIVCDNQYVKSLLIQNTIKYEKNTLRPNDIIEGLYDKIIVCRKTNESNLIYISSNFGEINTDISEMISLKFFVDIKITTHSILKILYYSYGLNNVLSLFYDTDFYEIYLFTDYFLIDELLLSIKKELTVFNPNKYSIDFYNLYMIKFNLCRDINEYNIDELPINTIFKNCTNDIMLKDFKKLITPSKKTVVGNYYYECRVINGELICYDKIEELENVSLDKFILLNYVSMFYLNLTDEKIDLSYVHNKPAFYEFGQYHRLQTELFTRSKILNILKSKCNSILGKVPFFVLYNNLTNTNNYPLIIFMRKTKLDLFDFTTIINGLYELYNNVVVVTYNDIQHITPEAIHITETCNVIVTSYTISNYLNNVTFVYDKIYNNLCEVARRKFEKIYKVDNINYYYILKKINKI